MNKKNYPYIITYILEIILVTLGTIFYRQPLLSVLLLLLLLLVPVSIILTKFQLDKITITAKPLSHEVIRGGKIKVLVTVQYKGFVPLLNCSMDFTFENLFYPHPDPQEFVFPTEVLRTGEFTLPFDVTKAGMIVINASSLNVTDYLHLYTFTRPLSINIEVPVTPKDTPAPPYPLKRVAASAIDGDPTEIYTTGGEKSQDIKQLREYRAGDRLKDIHWKLTAKTDELMVREFEEIKELYYLVFPILTVPNTSEGEPIQDTLQDTLEIFLSIGKDLIKQREPFSVAIYDSTDDTFTMHIVTEKEDLYASLYELYKCPVSGYEKAYDIYSQQSGANQGGMILIKDGKVKSEDAS